MINTIEATEWICLSDIPSPNNAKTTLTESCKKFWDSHGFEDNYFGIYQVSLTRPTELIHKDICYVGTTDKIYRRTYEIRSSAGADNVTVHHWAGAYVREEQIDINTVYVRVLTSKKCKNKKKYSALEKLLHQSMKEQFGYRFAWTEASSGHQGSRIHAQCAIKRVKTIEGALKLQKVLNEQIRKLKKGEHIK